MSADLLRGSSASERISATSASSCGPADGLRFLTLGASAAGIGEEADVLCGDAFSPLELKCGDCGCENRPQGESRRSSFFFFTSAGKIFSFLPRLVATL